MIALMWLPGCSQETLACDAVCWQRGRELMWSECRALDNA